MRRSRCELPRNRRGPINQLLKLTQGTLNRQGAGFPATADEQLPRCLPTARTRQRRTNSGHIRGRRLVSHQESHSQLKCRLHFLLVIDAAAPGTLN